MNKQMPELNGALYSSTQVSDDELRKQIDIVWLWITHGHDEKSIERSLDATMQLIHQHTATAVSAAIQDTKRVPESNAPDTIEMLYIESPSIGLVEFRRRIEAYAAAVEEAVIEARINEFDKFIDQSQNGGKYWRVIPKDYLRDRGDELLIAARKQSDSIANLTTPERDGE